MNFGVDPITNQTIVPAYNELTTSRNIMYGNTTTYGSTSSIVGSSLAWFRLSYEGHDVRISFVPCAAVLCSQ